MTNTIDSTLQARLDEFTQQMAANAPTEALQAFGNGIQAVVASGLVENGLQVGDKAPDFVLPNAAGGEVRLSELLKHGPVIVTFYRGEWCPFCNLTLRAYQQALPEFQQYSATLVAISPQTPDNSLTTLEKKELSYPVLSDVGNQIAREYRLVYRFSDELKQASLGMGIDLTQFNGDDSWELPISGTFVIGQDGNIKLAYVNPNFMQRLEPTAILESLR